MCLAGCWTPDIYHHQTYNLVKIETLNNYTNKSIKANCKMYYEGKELRSIRLTGVGNPLIVRWDLKGEWELVRQSGKNAPMEGTACVNH